jgi:uncharacterized protein (TIGR03437 family)
VGNRLSVLFKSLAVLAVITIAPGIKATTNQTITTLSLAPNQGGFSVGSTVVMLVSVSPVPSGGATPTGSVDLLDGATVVASKTLIVGQAVFSINTLSGGIHSLTARYNGDSSNSSSISGPLGLTINKVLSSVCADAVALTDAPTVSGQLNVGLPVTISCTVASSSGIGPVPTGTVTFKDTFNTVVSTIGTVSLDGTGTANLVISTLKGGVHFIQATYNGDNSYSPSAASQVLVFNMEGAPATVTASATTNPAVYGQGLAYVGTVNAGAAGNVDFFDGSTQVNFLPIVLVNSQAQFGPQPSTLTVGTHTIKVRYNGDINFQSAVSDGYDLVVNKASTNVSIRTSQTNGLAIVATITVVSPGSGTPTGSVDFMNGTTKLGSAVIDGSSHTAIATYVPTSAISGGVTAVYNGDDNFTGNTSSSITVGSSASGITLTSNLNPSTLGQSVTFTAVVSDTAGNGTPTGKVDFYDGTQLLGSGTLSKGQATYNTKSLTGGAHAIVAKYSGDILYQPSQVSMGQFVSGRATILTLTATPPSPVYGQTVTLTATIGPPDSSIASPTGSVTFQDAGSTLGTGSLSGGSANLSVNLSVGTHNITASYIGDSVWGGGQGTLTRIISQSPTTTTLMPSLNQAGQAVLTATVGATAPGSGMPTGSVQFVDSASNVAVATAKLAAGQAAVIVDGATATKAIVAIYGGDTNFSGSSSASQFQVVSSAANVTSSFAPDEATSAYNVQGLTGDTPGTVFPLSTSLGGASVKVTDGTGIARLAQLYGVFLSTGQLNFVIPSETVLGPAQISIILPGGATVSTIVNITRTSPAIFAANQNGQGVAVGQFLHVHSDNTRTVENIANYDASKQAYVPNPVNLGPASDRIFVQLYGTGIRHRPSDDSVSATVNGVTVPIQTAANGVYPGLDQMNVELPHSLAGAGTVNLVVSVDGKTTNTVTLGIQ